MQANDSITYAYTDARIKRKGKMLIDFPLPLRTYSVNDFDVNRAVFSVYPKSLSTYPVVQQK